jgi:hypothetical protein
MACVGDFRLCVGDVGDVGDEETIEAVASAQISDGEPSIAYSYCGAMCTPVQKSKDDHDPAHPTTTYPMQDDESHHPSETGMLSDEEDEGRASPSVDSLDEKDLPQDHPEQGKASKEVYIEIEETNTSIYSSFVANFQSPPKLIHHVDARTKAEGRKAELETLRRMSLTQTKGMYAYC